MKSIVNINNGIKKSTLGYQNRNTNQILIFDGMSRYENLLCTGVIIRVNTTLDHIDARASLPMYEGSCMVYRSE